MPKPSPLRKPTPPKESVLTSEAEELRANLVHLGLNPSMMGSAISDKVVDCFLRMIREDQTIPSCAKVAHALGLSPSTIQLRCQRLVAEGRMLRLIGPKGLPSYIPKVVGAG